jgi:hypothetical protein
MRDERTGAGPPRRDGKEPPSRAAEDGDGSERGERGGGASTDQAANQEARHPHDPAVSSQVPHCDGTSESHAGRRLAGAAASPNGLPPWLKLLLGSLLGRAISALLKQLWKLWHDADPWDPWDPWNPFI